MAPTAPFVSIITRQFPRTTVFKTLWGHLDRKIRFFGTIVTTRSLPRYLFIAYCLVQIHVHSNGASHCTHPHCTSHWTEGRQTRFPPTEVGGLTITAVSQLRLQPLLQGVVCHYIYAPHALTPCRHKRIVTLPAGWISAKQMTKGAANLGRARTNMLVCPPHH